MPRRKSGNALSNVECQRRYRFRVRKRIADLEAAEGQLRAEVARLRAEQAAGEPALAEAVRQTLDYEARHAGFLEALAAALQASS